MRLIVLPPGGMPYIYTERRGDVLSAAEAIIGGPVYSESQQNESQQNVAVLYGRGSRLDNVLGFSGTIIFCRDLGGGNLASLSQADVNRILWHFVP